MEFQEKENRYLFPRQLIEGAIVKDKPKTVIDTGLTGYAWKKISEEAYYLYNQKNNKLILIFATNYQDCHIAMHRLFNIPEGVKWYVEEYKTGYKYALERIFDDLDYPVIYPDVNEQVKPVMCLEDKINMPKYTCSGDFHS